MLTINFKVKLKPKKMAILIFRLCKYLDSKFINTPHKYFCQNSSSNSQPPYYMYIRLHDDPVLHKKCTAIPREQIKSIEVQDLIKQMVSVMRQNNLVGLAAPQVGVPLQIMMLEFSDRHMMSSDDSSVYIQERKRFPLKIFINPRMLVTDSRVVTFRESCASVSIAGLTPRAYGVEVKGLNENGDCVKWAVTGWPARILQHELDHLNGKLNIDIRKSKTFVDVIKKWITWFKYS